MFTQILSAVNLFVHTVNENWLHRARRTKEIDRVFSLTGEARRKAARGRARRAYVVDCRSH
jgi:hypothetical protein